MGAHGIVVTAATKAGYDQAPSMLRPGGTMVCVGMPKEAFVAGAPPIQLVLNRLNIAGKRDGDVEGCGRGLGFYRPGGLVRPILVRGSLKDVDRLSQDMLDGKLGGRAVIDLWA